MAKKKLEPRTIRLDDLTVDTFRVMAEFYTAKKRDRDSKAVAVKHQALMRDVLKASAEQYRALHPDLFVDDKNDETPEV